MKVRFLPKDIEVEIKPNQSVLEVAQENDIFIKSVCNGVPNCAECRISVVEGDHNVLPPSGKELQLIGTAHFLDQRRLSCQLKCFGDIVVDLGEQVEKEAAEGSKRRMKLGVTKEAELSHAKAGNLIDQDQELIKQVDEEVGDRVVDTEGAPNRKRNEDSSRNKEHNRKKSNRNRPGRGKPQGAGRPRRASSQGEGGDSSGRTEGRNSDSHPGSGKETSGSEPSNKNRNRNRNRNRSRNRPKGENSGSQERSKNTREDS